MPVGQPSGELARVLPTQAPAAVSILKSFGATLANRHRLVVYGLLQRDALADSRHDLGIDVLLVPEMHEAESEVAV